MSDMIITIARIQQLLDISMNPDTQSLTLRYTLPHRAAAGRLHEIRIEQEAVLDLLQYLHSVTAQNART